MAWIESHDTLARHPKTRRLMRALNISTPQAIGHLHLLWWWALEYADNGDLRSFTAADLADAACWEGAPDLFDQALTAAGFLNADRTIHDWQDYAGRLLEQRAKAAERQRTYRNGHRPDTPPSPSGPDPLSNGHVAAMDISPNSDVAVTSPSRNVLTVTNDSTNDQTVESTDRALAHEAQQRAVFDAELPSARHGRTIDRPPRPAYKPSDNPEVRAFVTAQFLPVYPLRDKKLRSPEKLYAAVASVPRPRWPELLTGAGYYAESIDAVDGKTKDPHNWINDGDWEEWAKGPAAPRPQKGTNHDRPLYPTADERRSDSFREWGNLIRNGSASSDDPGEPGPHLRLIG